MKKVVLRLFAFCFICAFVAEVIVLATVDHADHHSTVISTPSSVSLLQVMMEETEEVEEESSQPRLVFDLGKALRAQHDVHCARLESSVRNFRSGMQLFSGSLPVYTAIHSLVI